MGIVFGTYNQCSAKFPVLIRCKYIDFKPIEGKLDRLKQETDYLPFEISKSTIENAGYGLFAIEES